MNPMQRQVLEFHRKFGHPSRENARLLAPRASREADHRRGDRGGGGDGGERRRDGAAVQ